MTIKKSRLTQAQKSAQPQLSRLKKLGLFKGRVVRPSRYGVAQVKKFSGVLSGRAKVVTVPRAIAKEYREQYRVKGNKVVIPVAAGETVRYSRKRKEITSTREYGGKRIKARKPRAVHSAADLPRGPNIRYVVPLGGGSVRLRWDSWDQLVKDMTEYEAGKRGKGQGYAEWWKYVEIETIEDGDDNEDEFE